MLHRPIETAPFYGKLQVGKLPGWTYRNPFCRWTDCYAGGDRYSVDALPATVNKNVWKSEHDAGFDPIREAATQPFKMEDAEEVFKCVTPAIARFMRWKPPKSLNEYKAHRQARLQANDQSVFSFVIRRSDTMECLGVAGLDGADQPTQSLASGSRKQLMAKAGEQKRLKPLLNGRRRISRRRASFTPSQ